MTQPTWRTIVRLAVWAVCAFALGPTRADAQQVGKIVFTSLRDGNEEIYVTLPDGSGVTNLSHSPGQDADPKWSPDGSRILFYSDRSGNKDLFVMNADGTG